jgi:TatA/E family protein of Tat protein translocase
MLGSIGMPELLIIFLIALVIFGPRKLPELGRSLGKSLAEFKRASNELRSTLEEEIRLEDQREPQKTAQTIHTPQSTPVPPAPVNAPAAAQSEQPTVARSADSHTA